MPWLELKIDATPEDVPDLETRLMGTGALSVTLQDCADQPILEPLPGETPLWNQTRVIGLFDAEIDSRQVEQQLQLKEKFKLHWHQLEDRHWEREWIKHFKPLQCGENLWICPSWAEPPEPGAVNVKLDPGLAFGTGTHPTTFLCLNWLSKQKVEGKSILDFGCGSGILAIAGLLLGAKNAIGIDIDPQALRAMHANMLNNQLDPDQAVLALPDNDPMTATEIVMANILAGPLIDLAPQIIQRIQPGGLLCLSGILVSQIDDVLRAYENEITFEPAHTKDEWACLTGSRRI